MDNNFRDPATLEEFYIPSYKIVYRASGKIYKDSKGIELKNPKTGSFLEEIPRDPNKPIEVPFIGKSNNKAELSKMLSARSKEHYKKEISDVRYQKNKDLTDKFKDN